MLNFVRLVWFNFGVCVSHAYFFPSPNSIALAICSAGLVIFLEIQMTRRVDQFWKDRREQ